MGALLHRSASPAGDDRTELLVQLPPPLDLVDNWGSRIDHGVGLQSACALVLEVDLLWLAPEVAVAAGLDLVVIDRLDHLLVESLH